MKRHILVDTEGCLLDIKVMPASSGDREAALAMAADDLKNKYPRLELVWADQGYSGKEFGKEFEKSNIKIEVVERPKGVKGFVLTARRWVVERTFAWLGNFRRLSKDYEEDSTTSEALIWTAMSYTLLNRLKPKYGFI